jgi:DNA-binding XRE family transcriptional regulator
MKQNESKINIGENIRSWRNLKGIKQDDLAKTIDVSKTTMSHIETGEKTPSFKECESIAEALGISMQDLLHHPSIYININDSPQSVGYLQGTHNIQSRDNEILKLFFEENKKRDIDMKEFMLTVLEKITKAS